MAKILYWEEAVNDYNNLDGSLKKWVDKVESRLRDRGSEIGKNLGNKRNLHLTGCKEIKNRKLGIRLIFKANKDNTIEIIEVIASGHRKDEVVFKDAHRRINRKL